MSISEEPVRSWAGLDVESFRSAAAAWLSEWSPFAPSDYGAIVPEAEIEAAVAWQRRLADAGLTGLHWPVRWGGQGLTPAHTAAWLEECARAKVPPFLNMVGLVLTAEALLAYGTEEQKAFHLPPLRTGDRLWCQLFSEPEAGSDLAGLHTRARRSETGWVLEGTKVWTSNGHLADWGICLARTDDSVATHRGLSFFLVDMRAPGIEVRALRQITGSCEFDEVVFNDVELAPEALLGEPGAGWAVAMSTLTHERNHIGALGIRLSQRLDQLVTEAGAGPLFRDRVLQLWVRGKALVALGGQQARLGPAAASLMKLGVAQLSTAVADLGADLAGPASMLAGAAAAELIAAPAAEIAGGTTQIQKTIVGERLLRLPREPAPIRP